MGIIERVGPSPAPRRNVGQGEPRLTQHERYSRSAGRQTRTEKSADRPIRGPCSGPSVDHLRTSSRRARSRSSATPSPNELSCSQDLSGGYSAPRPLRVISATCRWTRRGESIQQRALLAAIRSVGARRFVQNLARKMALDTLQKPSDRTGMVYPPAHDLKAESWTCRGGTERSLCKSSMIYLKMVPDMPMVPIELG